MLKPINNQILVQFSLSRMRGSLFVPDAQVDGATACLVEAVGNKVNPQIKPGAILYCMTGFTERENPTYRKKVEGGEIRYHLIPEMRFYAMSIKDEMFPLGPTVLLRRDFSQEDKGLIEVPDAFRKQSLKGTILKLALRREGFKTNGLEIGSKVTLSGWDASMVQIELADGSHGLICHEQFLLYKEQ